MSRKSTVVFLYTELAGYIYQCMERLAESGADVHVFAYPVNPEAPFQFNLKSAAAHYYSRTDFSAESLKAAVINLSPDAVVCSGWIDSAYLDAVRSMPHQVKTVLALDNQAPKSIKGWLSLVRARFLYRKLFQFVWVPGTPQVCYAEKMGFDKNVILTGFYSADVKKFMGLFTPGVVEPFPKRFVFVGRYLEFKGIIDLWDAFDPEEMPGWELWCAGQGPLYEHRNEARGIHHIGFVQPDEMDTFVRLGGVFVLPSHREPWGVVVHEFAAAGYPLICSRAVGAAAAFLEEGVNGFLSEPANAESLKTAMKKMVNLGDEGLRKMSAESIRLAQTCTPDQWVNTLTKVMETN